MSTEILRRMPFFRNNSVVGSYMHQVEWEQTLLGKPVDWPLTLQATLNVMSDSDIPMFLVWGDDLLLLYNSAFSRAYDFAGQEILGRSLTDVWPTVAVHFTRPSDEHDFDDITVDMALNLIALPLTGSFLESVNVTRSFIINVENGKIAGQLCVIPNGLRGNGPTLSLNCISTNHSAARVKQAELDAICMAALLEIVPAGIEFCDATGKITSNNAENVRIWGPVPLSSDINGCSALVGWWADGSIRHGKRVGPHEWGAVRALRGELCNGDLIEIQPFGQPTVRRKILQRAAPLKNSANQIVGAVIAQVDITEQRLAEAALSASEAKFRTIADALPQIIWSTLPDGFHDYYNRRWYEFTGVPEGSTDGDGWNGLFHLDDQPLAWAAWRNCLQTGAPYEIEYRLRHYSGQYRWTLGRALPVFDENHEIIRWIGTCTDIHEQKLVHQMLLDADQRKDEFLAMLAHELRNPLAPIRTAAALLSKGIQDEAVVEQIAGVLTRQTSHLSSLINDLMDVSRVARGLVIIEHLPVLLDTVFSEAVEQIRPLLDAQKHQLEIHIPSAQIAVLGDQKRLVQIIGNLLSNSAKYTAPGGHILLDLLEVSGTVAISISDNGKGMSPQLVESAFDLFSQGERSADRVKGGLGIGLSLVKKLVTLHGGTVNAWSEGEGKGSIFTITLPSFKKCPVIASANLH